MTEDEIKEFFLAEMKRQGIKKTELARRLGVARSCVTQMFNKNRHWTVSQVEKVADALELKMSVSFHSPNKLVFESWVNHFKSV